MIVGATDMVTEGTEVGFTSVEEVGDDSELVVGADTPELFMVVGPAADPVWNPADVAKLESDERPVVSGTSELLLLRLKNETEVDAVFGKEETELLVMDAVVWLVVDEPTLGCWSFPDDELGLTRALELVSTKELEIPELPAWEDEELWLLTKVEELPGCDEIDEETVADVPACEEAVLEPAETAGCPSCVLEVEVLPSFGTALVNVVAECVAVDCEDVVIAEFCITESELIPEACGLSKGVIAVVVGPADIPVDEEIIVLVEEAEGIVM
jgi:hypothetical protein